MKKRTVKNHPLLAKEDMWTCKCGLDKIRVRGIGMRCRNCDKDIFEPEDTRYFALQDRDDGHLVGSITGLVLVCTHKLKAKGCKCVELVLAK